jgi:hypothetical protein
MMSSICALPLEVAVASIMLNSNYGRLPNPSTDLNLYELGGLDSHYIIIMCLVGGVYEIVTV